MLYTTMDSSTNTLTAPDKLLLKRIKNTILSESLLSGDQPIIIAVSGGADSVSLLHLLSFLFPAIKRIAVYIDHGLRPLEIDAEIKLVRQQAELCSASFVTVAVDVRKEREQKKCSLEGAARTLRYRALERIRNEFQAGAIAVGHTADDQAEEILLRLIRGSGSSGLSGMNIRYGKIIRPLLNEPKEHLLNFLRTHNIPFCEDSSNADKTFLRNAIRLDLLPKLENEYNQSMRQTLLQTASILKEEDALLTALTDSSFQKTAQQNGEQIILDLPQFSLLHPAIQRRILEKICWKMASRPSFKKIASLQHLATLKKSSEVHLPDGLRAVRQEGSIIFCCPSLAKGYRGSGIVKMDFPPVSIHGPGRYPVSALKRELLIEETSSSLVTAEQPPPQLLDASTVQFPLTLRPHIPGERFHPLGAPGRRKISRFLTDQKIPAMDRKNYPVILSQNTILAIIGLRVDHACRVTSQSKKVLQLQWKAM